MENAGTGSLGSLTEEEVSNIFNAMRVRKSSQTIHWHEFIAAGLSQCKFDDRNPKLAFDRLDAHHNGYVTFDDVLDLMGGSDEESEASIKAMFQDSLILVQSKHARIAYEEFLLLMKDQTHEDSQNMPPQQGQGPGPVLHSPIISYRRTASKGLSPPNLTTFYYYSCVALPAIKTNASIALRRFLLLLNFSFQ
jgi:Ca2+-binding EF-hand superfamily protein